MSTENTNNGEDWTFPKLLALAATTLVVALSVIYTIAP
ncbi:uncharacterized protein SOCEGT47_053310 [Sorangium cellulosum]|jgi:hypothetical protein|uniref:Uncharacterized protein n=1 Tax=Sorangium cellulosum TaxID=56 RepID=A0A4P2Q6C9_SORCE|nr:uncharacterized protein SOCEGT47_053310 [Sorangium cellulosum]